MFLKVIACEIAAREWYYSAALSPNLVDLEFLTQGHHDTPASGRTELQRRIDAVPAGKYDAILLGYGLCSSILVGVLSRKTPLVVPRAHDCITLFLGSKERYQECFDKHPGTYYYTSGWLECARRRGEQGPVWGGASLPAGPNQNLLAAHEKWTQQFGKEQADYLVAEMRRWTEAYTHGTLIHFDFLHALRFQEEVQRICREKSWQYAELPGDLRLFETMLAGNWRETDFLLVPPGNQVAASFDANIIRAEPQQG